MRKEIYREAVGKHIGKPVGKPIGFACAELSPGAGKKINKFRQIVDGGIIAGCLI